MGQMTVQGSTIQKALSDIQDVTEDHGGSRSESGCSASQAGTQPANIRSKASGVKVGQPETLPPMTTDFPWGSRFAEDGQVAHTGKQCSPWCSCACHSRKIFFVPSPFGTVLGSLSGLPLLTRRRAEHACKCPTGPSGSIVYRFPSWFWGRPFEITMKFCPLHGPEINIRFPRGVMP